MTRLSIRTLGPLHVILDGNYAMGFDSDKVRELLVYLAVESDRPHTREKLAGLLWPDYAEQSARTNLRSALANLRQVIGDQEATPPYPLVSRQTIQFNQAIDYRIDTTEFKNLVEGDTLVIDQVEKVIHIHKGRFLSINPEMIPYVDGGMAGRLSRS